MANKNRCTQCNRTLDGIREFWRLDLPPDTRFCSPQCRSDWERAKKEQDAHDEILRRCRATGIGHWVMRTSPSRRCLVINLNELELQTSWWLMEQIPDNPRPCKESAEVLDHLSTKSTCPANTVMDTEIIPDSDKIIVFCRCPKEEPQ